MATTVVQGILNPVAAVGSKLSLQSIFNPVSAIFGQKTLTTGQSKLSEKFDFYVNGNKNAKQSQDKNLLNQAITFFTNYYGARVTTIEDLDALHYNYNHSGATIDDGVTAYFQRPEKDDVPRANVQRAVQLAYNYTPYNNVAGSWSPDKFLAVPMVGYPPNVAYGQPPPGQAAGATTQQPAQTTAATTSLVPPATTATTSSKWIWIGAGALALIIITVIIVRRK